MDEWMGFVVGGRQREKKIKKGKKGKKRDEKYKKKSAPSKEYYMKKSTRGY